MPLHQTKGGQLREVLFLSDNPTTSCCIMYNDNPQHLNILLLLNFLEEHRVMDCHDCSSYSNILSVAIVALLLQLLQLMGFYFIS